VSDFREMLARLEEQGELVRSRRPIDLRYVPAVLRQADKAVLFERVRGYDMPVVGGLYWTRRRLAVCLGWPEKELGTRYLAGTQQMIEPVTVDAAPCQDVVLTGDEVDLSRLPVPTMHERDGGPYIGSGVVASADPEQGANAGVYRLMLRGRNVTGIDLVTASDMRSFYERRLARREPFPIAVAIGVHAFEVIAAGSQAPAGVNEFAIAGGLHGAPVQLVRCRTVDLRVPAQAEVVLEGYLEPIGWTKDEGPFGEFAGMQGDLKWNPVFRITAMTHRRDAIFHTLQMPWENDWLSGPVTEAHAWRILREAGLRPVCVRATEGGCCFWNVVASIRKRAGEGKNALLALLSLPFIKTAIVVDPDIDIYDPVELEWAMTFRCQPDRDVLIVSGAKAKHVDPSVRPWELRPGTLPLTSKMGIDATLPEGADPVRFERLRHVFLDDVRAEDYLGAEAPNGAEAPDRSQADVAQTAARIEALLRERPRYFHELLAALDVDYRSVVRAWFEVRSRHELKRDTLGHYSLD
jgi:2,5-furandicarboxylate decarboxylase 1